MTRRALPAKGLVSRVFAYPMLLAVLAGGFSACSREGCDAKGDPEPAADDPTVAKGAILYREMCSVCHGRSGEGARGPKLRGYSHGKEELTAYISENMPKGRAGKCTGACAESIAAY